MVTRLVVGAMVCGLCSAAVAAVNVTLTVREQAGVARVANPVNSGVPLPKGAVRDVSALRLLDAKGNPVLASIEPRCRWLGDNSLKWVTVHFLATVPAKGEQTYRLVTSDAAAPKGPLTVRKEAGRVVVVTGPAKFVVSTRRLAPFEHVFVRGDATKPFTAADEVLAGPAAVRLVGRNGRCRVVNKRSELAEIGGQLQQTGRVSEVLVEERGPGRAVVALMGTFSEPGAESLDFTARLSFYAGSSLAQMTFSVRNRQLDSMARFFGIERLAVEVPMKVDRGRPVAACTVDGQTHQRPLTGERPITLLQSARNKVAVTRPDGTTAEGKTSAGWAQLNTGKAVLTAGNRWFWQTYPKGLTIGPDGRVTLELAPMEGKRVDLFTAGAKTHFLFFDFAKPAMTAPESIAAGTTHPLVAQCDPNWYCQETRVFGDLYANNPDLFEPKYRDVIKRYQARIDECLRTIVRNRPRDTWTFGVDEYGWLDFGSGLHHRTTMKNSSEASWWDSNYYDFPHAALVNYVRTGDLINLTTAEEAGLHLADIDICHSFPGRPERAGSPRSGPVIGHFRNYAGDTRYMGHDSFTFYKNESLYELYYLTGERWYHDVGLMSSNFAMVFWGRGALRNVAHGIWGVLSAYHDTHKKKYLERARFFVDKWAKPWQDKYGGSFNDQLWMYGLQFEAYDKYYRVTGDLEAVRYNVKAIDAAMREEVGDGKWKNSGARSGICLAGYGLACDYTGDRKYLDYGLAVLEKTTRASGTRVKTFAQQFRASPYFLKVLTKGYQPQPILNPTP